MAQYIQKWSLYNGMLGQSFGIILFSLSLVFALKFDLEWILRHVMGHEEGVDFIETV